MAVCAYTRVSTDQQAREGVSLAEQERQAMVYAELYQLGPPSIFREEGVSGSVPLDMRPRGAAMLAQLQPGDIIIASKLDRLFRSALDALRLIKRFQRDGIKLHLLDMGGEVINGPVAKLVFTVLVACAQFEHSRGAERVREAHVQRRLRGKKHGPARFGWRLSEKPGVWREEPREQEIIREICRLKSHGTRWRTIRTTIADQYGVTLGGDETIKRIWLYATDRAAYEAWCEKTRKSVRQREMHRWDDIIRPERLLHRWTEAVRAYAESIGFDLAREPAAYPRNQRQTARRVHRLAAAFGEERTIDTVGQDDLDALANQAFPVGSGGTKNREVIGPAAAVIHYVAAKEPPWVEDWRVRRFPET
jgi:putative DNA-invertase from lambdoid prophage Rac